ncbi:hypothetical protein BDV26DRAFT_287310 [Aspergillus bertholletiae]|uniref:AAA+ ATPase domain-containing protein n=1 Tax=Aspergillus bertholletiae TaxID=1226010 RepID=A0A5N7BPX2_9EURO|nr:hypothetical protein BDV26DRAFT_287310 [Aspergillus bertholletiae]
MAPAQKAITAPPSPYLQVTTPPDSHSRLSPLWSVDEDYRKQVLVHVIRQVLTDETSALTFNANRLARLLEAIPGSTHRSSTVVPPNTPRTAPLGSMATDEAKKPIGLMAPSPIDPSAYADWTSADVNHHLPDSAQTKPIPSSAPSEPVTMDHLKELFMALLEGKPQPPAPSALSPEDAEDAAAQAAAEGPGARFKRVMEIWDKGTARYKIVDSIEPEVDDMDQYVFVAREHIDERSKKSTVYIDVKSAILCDILREVLGGVKAIEQSILFHFLPELNATLKSLASTEGVLESTAPVAPSPNDPDAYAIWTGVEEQQRSLDRSHPGHCDHLHLLIDHISEVYTATAQRLEPLLQGGNITYDLLNMLFKSGCYVYTTCLGTGKPRCVIFDAGEELTTRGVTFYKLECHYLDYNGQVFGEVGIELAIVKYRGSRPIHSLEAFPLAYHPDRDQVWQDLVTCGREFRELIGNGPREGGAAPIRYCRGTAFIMKNDKAIAMNIDSRVAVDAAFFHVMEPNYHQPWVSDTWQDHSLIQFFSIDAEEHQAAFESVKSNGKEMGSMVDGDFAICCPTVRCFSFDDKLFLECAVGDLRRVEWSQVAFDRLQLPEDKRHILLSVITSRLCNNGEVVFDDFIKGKGRGLNVLLYGVPGVGKTFTVEATAEHFQVPLYSVSAGELIADHGDPLQLDMVLDRIFHIAKHFNAIILIDEADVFMENRASYHSNHNRLVTIFLRKLEYYEGLLFLTTNRVMEFDEAVLSRIHLKIKYADLTKDARRGILTSFLADARTAQGPPVVEPSELDRLASTRLNGRDVKNLVSIAQALAAVDKSRVTYQYLESAAKANDKFDEEFSSKGLMDALYT